MGNSERKRIHELITRYEYEPELRDVYVEGEDDKSIIDGIMKEYGIQGVSVYEISTVDVPSDGIEENSNRTRVIKLAKELAGTINDNSAKVAFVIDSDFDLLAGYTHGTSFLFRTDYANMEMYYFADEIIEKLGERSIGINIMMNDRVAFFLIGLLKSLFIVRFVNSREKWHLKELSYDRLLKYENGQFSFSIDEYIRRYLNSNERYDELGEFQSECDSVVIDDERDARHFMHGHDFLSALRFILRSFKSSCDYSEEIVYALLRCCHDYSCLAKEPMFAALVNHIDKKSIA